ncbi:MAG: DUF58 domain-containing protein [Hyphomicrobiales bacterium]|nr:DUF58 domain-containing protein [Hyphomicrobiales bacterium]
MASPAMERTGFGAIHDSLAEAKDVAGGLPDLLIEARRVASTVIAGWHGRRIAGRGETFWQFRPFMPGEAASSVDWRRSARDDHFYVREREWEAAHMVWLWGDLSDSMIFQSKLSSVTKRDRMLVLILATAELLAAAGERVGLLGESDPLLARNAAERLADFLARARPRRPVLQPLRRFTDVILISDFFDPLAETEAMLDAIVRTGARAHLVQVVDPIEETFAYRGRTEFIDPESGLRHIVGRAESHRDEYQARLAALRDRLSTICRRLDWSFLVHRTDRPATEPLLALHARLADRHAATSAAPTGRAA